MFDIDISALSTLGLDWVSAHGLAIALVVVLAWIAQYAVRFLIEKIIRQVITRGSSSKEEEERRENTLIEVGNGIAVVLIWITAAFTVLSEVGVEIGPLLAAAGVAGIAIGFGGQYLIRDFISGFFIVIENQYRTGDVVCIGEACGSVESVTLRATVLRDLDGTVHHVPNGEITRVANLSKKFARVNVDVGVSYDADLEQVIEVVNRVGKELADDPEWKTKIKKAPAFLRVNDFADSAVMIKILGDTKPLEQWAVAGELRRRLKRAFDAAGIEIPFPQRVVHAAK